MVGFSFDVLEPVNNRFGVKKKTSVFWSLKTYKIGYSNITDDINEELRDITNNLSIGNRVDVMLSFHHRRPP
jgi:hypothetical protein